jgi:hypothetical protein
VHELPVAADGVCGTNHWGQNNWQPFRTYISKLENIRNDTLASRP